MDIANNILPKLFRTEEIFVTPEAEELLKDGHGNNRNGIIVLYQEEQQAELVEFLKKILQAAALDLEKDIWIKGITGKTPLSWTNLKKSIDIHYFLSFGVPPAQLGLTVPFQEFKPTSFFDVVFLFAPALSELENNKPAKSKLWAALQEIFLTKNA